MRRIRRMAEGEDGTDNCVHKIVGGGHRYLRTVTAAISVSATDRTDENIQNCSNRWRRHRERGGSRRHSRSRSGRAAFRFSLAVAGIRLELRDVRTDLQNDAGGRPASTAAIRRNLPWRRWSSQGPGSYFTLGPADPHPAYFPAICKS